MEFPEALKIVLSHESMDGGRGYTFDPRDPGGETAWGISKRAFPQEDIKNLTVERATEIYYVHYWKRLKIDSFPPEIRLCLFDSAVNQGPIPAVKMLQKVLGTKQDGYPGPKTQAKARKFHRWRLVVNFQAERAMRYSRTENFNIFGLGWMRRLQSITLESGL